jgi:large subunit ribosomal protein L25
MTTNSLDATLRPEGGKGPARRLRNAGRIPAVAYGKDLEAVSIAVSPKDLRRLLESEHGLNTVINLAIEGRPQISTLVAGYQYHPVSRALLHADFKQVSLDQPVDVKVPLEMTGKAPGVTLGGTLKQVFRELPVRTLPGQIPVKILVDVSSLGLEQTAQVKDLKLPEGVKVLLPEAQTIAGVYSAKRAPAEEEEAAAPGAAAAKPGDAKEAKDSKAPPAAKKE